MLRPFTGLDPGSLARVANVSFIADISRAPPALAACGPTSRFRPAVGAKLPGSIVQWVKLTPRRRWSVSALPHPNGRFENLHALGGFQYQH
jgi:hypothetical protein